MHFQLSVHLFLDSESPLGFHSMLYIMLYTQFTGSDNFEITSHLNCISSTSFDRRYTVSFIYKQK